MTYFWILGPFFFLIERDPADLWLTLISIIFIIRCILQKRLELGWSTMVYICFYVLDFWLNFFFLGPYKIFFF